MPKGARPRCSISRLFVLEPMATKSANQLVSQLGPAPRTADGLEGSKSAEARAGPHELGCADACHWNVTSRQTPARCQRYLWSRHRQRKCRTIRSSRLNSAGHFVTDDRAHGGFVVFGSFTFRMGVIGPGNRSRERRSHGPTDRHWIGLNGAVVFNRRSARRGPNTSLPRT